MVHILIEHSSWLVNITRTNSTKRDARTSGMCVEWSNG